MDTPAAGVPNSLSMSTPLTASHTLIFQPGDRRVEGVAHGTSIMRAAIEAGLDMVAPCGGTGSCGRCRVRIISGDIECDPSPALTAEEWSQGWRLACKCHVISNVECEIPDSSRLAESRVRDTLASGEGHALMVSKRVEDLLGRRPVVPVVKVFSMQLEPPSAHDNLNDLARFRKGLSDQFGLTNVSVDSIWIRNMPAVLRQEGWLVTATVVNTPYGYKVINLESGARSDEAYAVALDVGTTTIWGQLLDLNRQVVLAEASAYSHQIRYGEDVISRVIYSQGPGRREALQQAVVDTINDVLDQLVENTGVDRGSISHIMAAGNTTMTCLLVGIDPKYLRLQPYVPPADFIPPVRAVNLGDGIHVGRHVHVYTFPTVASYVGGDIVSGVVGAGLTETEKITLYLDIGTNGEAVVGNREWLIAASCSAGPAFEGGGLRHGMRASPGAIEAVRIDPLTFEPAILTVGDRAPLGICGSGIIDAVAELLKAGVIGQNGRFNPDVASPRVRHPEGAAEYVLVEAQYSGTGSDIVVSETDIDNVIRAKAAMFAGVQTLLESVMLSWNDLEQIMIAGGFGHYLRLEQAMALGLFPELPHDRFLFVGNGSLLGAALGSFSIDMLKTAHNVALMMTNVELSDNQRFVDNYMAANFLPHTDMSLFPTMERRLSGSAGREKV